MRSPLLILHIIHVASVISVRPILVVAAVVTGVVAVEVVIWHQVNGTEMFLVVMLAIVVEIMVIVGAAWSASLLRFLAVRADDEGLMILVVQTVIATRAYNNNDKTSRMGTKTYI